MDRILTCPVVMSNKTGYTRTLLYVKHFNLLGLFVHVDAMSLYNPNPETEMTGAMGKQQPPPPHNSNASE